MMINNVININVIYVKIKINVIHLTVYDVNSIKINVIDKNVILNVK